MKKSSTWTIVGVVVLAAVAGTYWTLHQRAAPSGAPDAPGASGDAAASGRPAGGGAAVSVSVSKAIQRDQPVSLDATGIVMPLNIVDVRPQISGLITQVNVHEGQFVQRGQLLFTLDDRSDQANVAKAKAQLAKDQATLADAQRQFTRSKELVDQKFLSQSALDTAQTLVASQQAVVGTSQAALDATQLNLGYNRVVAPAGGRIGSINVYVGSLVQPTTSVLVTITQLDPIAVGFNLPQRYLPDALQALRSGEGSVQAQLTPRSEPLIGKLQFVDNNVDASSGTVRVKAVFDNPKQSLWPGAYAPVHMTVRTLAGAVIVPQEAVVNSQEGDSVYIVSDDNKALVRKVEVVYSAGADAAVTGVNAGDSVIVDGRRNVRNGVRVAVRAPDKAGKSKGGKDKTNADPASMDKAPADKATTDKAAAP